MDIHDLIEKFKDKFVGQIGMRIVQRPKDIGDELDEYIQKQKSIEINRQEEEYDREI
jgi:hypothetical protein